MFEQIIAIRNRFQDNAYNITDDELIASAMAAAPDQYHSIITSTQITKGNALTLQDVENAMTQYWRVHVGVKEHHDKNSSDKEVIMSAVSGGITKEEEAEEAVAKALVGFAKAHG